MSLPPASVLTLDVVIDYLIVNKIDDPRLYDYLTRAVDQTRIDHWTNRIDKINGIVRPGNIKPKEWEGRTNELKGRCFEKIGGIILSSAMPFHAYNRVPSTMNEIDWLVELGPSAKWLQATSEWGTHFICECKFGTQTINAGWIGKLNTVLITHSASVGLLISSRGLGKGGGSQKLRFQLQMLAAVPPVKVIICMNTQEVTDSLTQRNFLRILCQRYVQTKIGAAKLSSLS
jgi:hypothetical protein